MYVRLSPHLQSFTTPGASGAEDSGNQIIEFTEEELAAQRADGAAETGTTATSGDALRQGQGQGEGTPAGGAVGGGGGGKQVARP